MNDSFEHLVGLKKAEVTGRRATEIFPGIKDSTPELFEIYGRVALTGKEETLEIFFEPLGIWFSISVYSPGEGDFVAVFDDVTERKQADEDRKRHTQELEALLGVSTTMRRAQSVQELAAIFISQVLDVSDAELGVIFWWGLMGSPI